MNTTYNIRIDSNIKKQADALYKSMGLSLSSAVNLFLTQSVIQHRLPLTEVTAEPFYADALPEGFGQDVQEAHKAIETGDAELINNDDDLKKALSSKCSISHGENY
ncbi:MAG: type II toxin-antitoxin system RelB/DinJ family antitoxin [Clostridiales bacterium]|jgi:DNA-damage-inducible protein J|nr:type II toxin-antitoxin system RelB/DinJ family antitoxin [Clostridiales bacterium]